MSDTYEKNGDKLGNNSEQFFPMEAINRFGERLKEAIGDESNMSFAKKCGLSDTLIGKYVRGESYPSIAKLPAIAKACGKSMSWLLSGVDDEAQKLPGSEQHDNHIHLDSDELTNWWEMIFKSLTDSEKQKAVMLFQRYGINALLPNIIEENAAASIASKEILLQRGDIENSSSAPNVSTQNKKAG